MKYLTRSYSLISVILIALSLEGCVRALLPTSPKEFAVYSEKSRPYTVNLDYVSAYANLKNMYTMCQSRVNMPGVTNPRPEGSINRQTGVAQMQLYGSHGTILEVVEIQRVNEFESVIVAAMAKNKLYQNTIFSRSIDDFAIKIKGWVNGSKKNC